MPTLQHRLLRTALGTVVGTMRGTEMKIPTLRKLMDLGSLAFFLPWGVESEKIKIDHIPCEWILPRQADHNKVLLYFHGGGYAVGSTQTHRALVGEIARQAGYCALIVEYRLAPENPFPAAMNDAVRTYDWLLETGHHPEDIIIAGDSAGGGLSLACMLKLKERGTELPAAAILISPWVDLTISQPSVVQNVDKSPIIYLKEMEVWAANYAGKYPTDYPLISPLFADLSGLPPLLIQVSDSEVLIDEDTLLANKAKEAGVEVEFQVWQQLIHVWHIYWRYLPSARDAVGKIVDFIDARSPAVLEHDAVEAGSGWGSQV